jgi:hypothetical protein
MKMRVGGRQPATLSWVELMNVVVRGTPWRRPKNQFKARSCSINWIVTCAWVRSYFAPQLTACWHAKYQSNEPELPLTFYWSDSTIT